jgi:cytochrome c6
MKLPTTGLAGALVAALALSTASPAVQAADPTKGQRLYSANCAVCHGFNGRSVMPGTPDFNQADRLMRPDFTLLATIRAGKNAMPSFQGILPDRDIMDIIAYIRTLR